MTDPTKRIAGVVLAGGRSSRFGSDKAEALYKGRRLIDWSIAALEPYCEAIFVSGRDHASLPRATDRPEPGMGPLGGLAGAMQAVSAAGFTHLLSLPCDTPELPAGILDHLSRLESNAYVTSCPIIGLWRAEKGKALEEWLMQGRPRSVRNWALANGYRALECGPILNINHLADID